jgi:excisionase family DNA binding protein
VTISQHTNGIHRPTVKILDADRLLLTAREAAARLAVSEKTLWLMTAPRGTLPCVRVGSRGVRYDPADLRAWIEAAKLGSAQRNGRPV